MDNLFMISSSNNLQKIFETTQDKLIALMFYTKNVGKCRIAKEAFEKSSKNHITTVFCVIDMDKLEGDSRYTSNVSNMPRFDLYYMDNCLGTLVSSNEKEIEMHIRNGEQYVMTQSNMNNKMNQYGGQYGNNMQQINPMQIQQQILNMAMAQNPVLANQLMQNPQMLQQYVQRQIQQIQMQNQMGASMQNPLGNPMQNSMTTPMQNPMTTPIPTPMQNTLMNQIGNATQNQQMNNALPTLQQMQQMFQIFQMMQQMGILNTPTTGSNDSNQTGSPNPTLGMKMNPISGSTQSTEEDKIMELPNGDKLVPLPGGKYGLIKKN